MDSLTFFLKCNFGWHIPSHKWNSLRWHIVAIATLAFMLPQSLYAQSSDPNPAFDWTMPARFGLDEDANGLIDYFTTAEAISPTEWTVTLDGCASTSPGQTIITYRWSMPNQPDVESGDCTATVLFPEEGSYDVTLTIVTSQGFQAAVTQPVTVEDHLIVSLGDSFASGEGAPDQQASLPFQAAVWQNADYHRSAFSGPAVAARLLEESSSKSSVTFVHLARSGARIVHEDPDNTVLSLTDQIAEAQGLLGQRQVDALLLSIGANDIGLSRLIQSCVVQQDCDQDDFTLAPEGLAGLLCQAVIDSLGDLFGLRAACEASATEPEEELDEFTDNYTQSAASIFAERSALLPGKYDEAATMLQGLNIQEGGIYLTEYPRPTRDDSGVLCSAANDPNNLPGMSDAEYRWADEEVLEPLLTIMQEAAQRHGWTYIGDIADGFSPHGYCATDNWINRIDQSVTIQLGPLGTMHPNQAGHAFVGERIAEPLRSALISLDFAIFVPLLQQ